MPDTTTPPAAANDADLNVRLMEPTELDLVATLLADATREATPEAARAILDTHRDQQSAIFVIALDGDPIAAYILEASRVSVEVILFAVRQDFRRRGIGTIIMQDALRRAGGRPMVVETGEATMPFFTAIGFKKFGRRKGPNGEPRYRVGWHTPGQRTATDAPKG